MTSITAQQTKLDLELVPKENRLDIGKCNGRIPRGFSPREPTFQVTLDAIALTPCYPAFLITADVPEVYMHQFWNCIYKHDDFYRFKIDKKKRFKLTLEVFREILQICPRVQGRDFDPLPSEEDTVSFLRDLGHTGVINSLNDVVVDQMHQPWRTFAALINRSLSGKTTGLDKLRLSRAQIIWGMYFQKNIDYVELLWEDFTYQIDNKEFKKQEKMWVPPKVARKFKKASPSKKESDLVPGDKEPVKKGKRLKTPAKKSASKPATGIVIKEPPVETKSKGKEKEKVDVAHEKRIELLSEVALTEKALLKEVRKKSLKDFHKTHPSGSGTVAVKPPSVEKITPPITSEGTDDSNNEQESSDESSKQENESEEHESDSEQDEESEDDNQEEEEIDQENESEDDELKSDEEQGMDDTTDQFDDDADERLEEPTQTATDIVQGEGTDAEMTESQQGNENLETTQEQVVEDAHVTISTVTKKTEVPVTSSSRSSDLASKFLNFSDIPHTDAEIVSPLDVPVHHEVPRTQAPTLLSIPVSVIPESSPVFTNIPQSSHTFTPTPILATPTPPPTIQTTNPLSNLPDFSSVFRFNDRISALEKEVVELKKDPLHIQLTSLVDEHLDTRLGETREEEVSNFAPPVIEKLFHETRDEVTLAKASSQPQSTYEAASTLTEFELKKILLDKMEKSESYLTAPEHRECYDGLKKSYALDQDFFYSYDVYTLKRGQKDKDKDEDPSAGSDRGLKRRKTSKDADPTTEPKKKDSTSGSSKGTKSQPRSSGKSVQSQEPVFEVALYMPQDKKVVPWETMMIEPRKETASRLIDDKSLKDFDELMNTPIDFSAFIMNECYKVLSENLDWENPKGGDYPFDLSKPLPLITHKYALWGISHWREQRKSFYAFARGMQSRGDVYSTKRILAVTHVSVMRKYGYGYLEEIVVRRADNVLYRFKEGDFPRLWINDIEDMLLLVVQNRLNNLSGDDVADFAIALRMYTRSLVIQKRVEDLQLGVESYQKKINVTKPDTTRSDL
ncbi:hypothetical protein Tco_0105966 [Tanacetum coccineum]